MSDAPHPHGPAETTAPRPRGLRPGVWIGVSAALAAVLGAAALALRVALTGASIEADVWGAHVALTEPRWLAALALLPLVGLAARRSLADLGRGQLALSLAARGLLLTLLVVVLAGPVTTRDATRTATVFVVDVSESIPDAALERARGLVTAALRARAEADAEGRPSELVLVTFAGSARRVPLERDALEAPPLERLAAETAGPATDLEGALELSLALIPPGHLGRLVVVSDGAETRGSARLEIARARAAGVHVHHVAVLDGPPAEIAVVGIEVPETLRVGAPHTVRVHVRSTGPARARLRLYQDGLLNGLDGVRDLELAAGETEATFRSVVHVAGPVTYRAEIEAEDPTTDHAETNDAFSLTAVVPGRPRVLYVEGTPSAATYLARALEAADFDVDVRTPRATPTTVTELEGFELAILSDVAADEVPRASMDAIARWVEAGGGFLMAGGEDGFGLGGWQGTPIAEILPVRLDGARRRDEASIAIALVIDKSGSMAGEKIELAREAARATVELLSPADSVGVIGFDGAVERVVRMQSAGNRLQILRDIGTLSAGGGTAIFPALDAAYQDLETVRARLRHVILLTDGNTAEVGIPTLASAMQASGITVSVVGIGDDVNRALLSEIASSGGGRAYFTSDPHNIPRIFVRETTAAMQNSVVEEYFLPRVVRDAAFLRGTGIAEAPWLRGYVSTRARPAPAEVILETESGEPLLARWRVGLGWSVAWTSDVKNRWAADWIRWPGYGRFFAQIVREHARRRRESELPIETEIDDASLRISVDAIDDDDRFIDDLVSEATLTGPVDAPAAERETRTIALEQVAPGRYEARVPLVRFGSYVVHVEHRRGGETIATSEGRASYPYPREHAILEPDAALLRALSDGTGGAAYAEPADVLSAGDEHLEASEPARAPLLFAALGVLLADLLLRRVRLGRTR